MSVNKWTLHTLQQCIIGFNRFLMRLSFKIQTDLNYSQNHLDNQHYALRSSFELHF